MRLRLSLPIAIVCCAVGAAPAAAATIAPAALVPRPLELPGFGFAETTIRVETSPKKYAKTILEDSPSEVRSETRLLKKEGFQEGVRESLTLATAGAQADAVVFGSARSARRELARSIRDELKTSDPPEMRFSDASIPGAHGFLGSGETPASKGLDAEKFRYVDLLFTSGRCFFLIGNALYQSPPATDEEVERAPLAGAASLYVRVKRLCAG